MRSEFHREITSTALQDRLSPRALSAVIEANLAQDGLSGLIGHPEYHYDDSAFEAGDRYVARQRDRAVRALAASEPARVAWKAFGRLSHAVQDFYAHSNYVALWLARQQGDPPPEAIDPCDPGVRTDPALRSGRVYLLEALAYVPGLRSLALQLLPRDAHAWMNLDGPERGEAFPSAREAARKRTRIEFDRTLNLIVTVAGDAARARFQDLAQPSAS